MEAANRDEVDAQIRARFPDVDIAFRSALVRPGKTDLPISARALDASDRAVVGGRSFVNAYMGAAVNSVPLLDLASVITTSNGEFLDWGFTVTNMSANTVSAPGATITASDPVFGGGELDAYGYKALIEASAEVVNDAAIDFETFAAERVAPVNAFEFGSDAWDGDGSDKPEGLLAGLSTVAAAGASVVTFDDIANLLNGVPAAYRYSGRCTILLSPGAHIDLLQEDPTHAWHTGTIHGFPFRVDANLANPATTTKSVVAGDFASAYLIRLLPIRIDADSAASSITDRVLIRVVLRADGHRMVTDAARALVHP